MVVRVLASEGYSLNTLVLLQPEKPILNSNLTSRRRARADVVSALCKYLNLFYVISWPCCILVVGACSLYSYLPSLTMY